MDMTTNSMATAPKKNLRSRDDVRCDVEEEHGLEIDSIGSEKEREKKKGTVGSDAVVGGLELDAEGRPVSERDVAGDRPAFELFRRHADDMDRLSIAGLGSAMEDLGLLSNRSEKESDDVVVATFASLDAGKKNFLSPDEFATLYDKAHMPTLADALRKEHPMLVERLQRAFKTWATFGKRRGHGEEEVVMGSPSFIKLLRDTRVVRSVEDMQSFDVVFAKVKERGASKITFAQFVDGLRLVADDDQCDLDLMTLVTRICDATPSVNASESPPRKPGLARQEFDSTRTSPARRSIQIDVLATPGHDALYAVFESYARFGSGKRGATNGPTPRLSSQQFSKLARESKLETRAVTSQKLDVIFASCRSNKTCRDRPRGLSFDEFQACLTRIAKEEGVMPAYIVNKVRRRMDAGPMINSPTLTSSSPLFVRLHDDARSHCGVYGRNARRCSTARTDASRLG